MAVDVLDCYLDHQPRKFQSNIRSCATDEVSIVGGEGLRSFEDLERKIKRSFSGGQPTIEEHRRIGGDCSKDVAFQYLQFFFERDDNALLEIKSEYESGRMLAGEMKQVCIDKAWEWLQGLSERREMWSDRLDEFLAPDAL